MTISRWLAYKAIAYTLLVVVLPVVLWNLGVSWVGAILDWAIGQLPQQSFVGDIAGMAGWMLVQLNIPQAFDVLLSALTARFIIKIVRGV